MLATNRHKITVSVHTECSKGGTIVVFKSFLCHALASAH